MASNGLSNRRVVLKRPPVCISEGNKCGSCSFDWEPNPGEGFGPFPFQCQGVFNCKYMPTNLDFKVVIAGGATFVDPQVIIQPSETAFDIAAVAPFERGEYLIALIITNADNCFNIVEKLLVVH